MSIADTTFDVYFLLVLTDRRFSGIWNCCCCCLFQGELSLEANFYLRDNPDGTVSFESVASPNTFLAVKDGTTLLKNFSIFIVVSNSTHSIAISTKISVLQDASSGPIINPHTKWMYSPKYHTSSSKLHWSSLSHTVSCFPHKAKQSFFSSHIDVKDDDVLKVCGKS